MRLDKELTFSDAQAVTVSGVSTNVINLGGAFNLGVGREMALEVTLGTIAKGSDADETYTIDLETDDNEGITSASGVGSQPVITIPRLSPAGTKFSFVLPKSLVAGMTNEQFLRLRYKTTGTNPAVTLDARLVPADHIGNAPTYASGFSIS